MENEQRKHDFTLIELLVVIAIIAILAAMLMPALESARREALGARCTSNLKNIGTSLILYSNDWDGYYPVRPRNANSWPYSWDTGNDYRIIEDYFQGPETRCPLAPSTIPYVKGESGGPDFWDASGKWTMNGYMIFSGYSGGRMNEGCIQRNGGPSGCTQRNYGYHGVEHHWINSDDPDPGCATPYEAWNYVVPYRATDNPQWPIAGDFLRFDNKYFNAGYRKPSEPGHFRSYHFQGPFGHTLPASPFQGIQDPNSPGWHTYPFRSDGRQMGSPSTNFVHGDGSVQSPSDVVGVPMIRTGNKNTYYLWDYYDESVVP